MGPMPDLLGFVANCYCVAYMNKRSFPRHGYTSQASGIVNIIWAIAMS